ncbi:MAG: ATP-binding cassette domain-containing protein [Chitinophagaceae bacterium]|jgi:ABC-type branched-subunit amino acid transport system ATPase component|nr:ATP-binding cassette domain-containing protein [Chitinophagaceae bacterium]
MTHILEADGIQLSFYERKILSGIYLKCETGKITGLLGRNGQGKSCLLKIMFGSLPAEKSIRFDRISIVTPFKHPELVRYLPQHHFIPGSLSIKRVFKDFDLDFTKFYHTFTDMKARETSLIGSLSGGERRLIEVYTIAKSTTRFILLDEPFTQLSPMQIEKLKILLHEEKENKGILVTDHMYQHILDISDSLYILSNGRTHLTKNISDIEQYGYLKTRS